jgi:DNA helicase-2/ATP-dependent DNA helicase PcrA
VRAKWQQQFKYVMIDEYQDTNSAQYKLIKLLTGPHQNIAVVGDDWQSIYSWRGADFRNILNFEKDYLKLHGYKTGAKLPQH